MLLNITYFIKIILCLRTQNFVNSNNYNYIQHEKSDYLIEENKSVQKIYVNDCIINKYLIFKNIISADLNQLFWLYNNKKYSAQIKKLKKLLESLDKEKYFQIHQQKNQKQVCFLKPYSIEDYINDISHVLKCKSSENFTFKLQNTIHFRYCIIFKSKIQYLINIFTKFKTLDNCYLEIYKDILFLENEFKENMKISKKTPQNKIHNSIRFNLLNIKNAKFSEKISKIAEIFNSLSINCDENTWLKHQTINYKKIITFKNNMNNLNVYLRNLCANIYTFLYPETENINKDKNKNKNETKNKDKTKTKILNFLRFKKKDYYSIDETPVLINKAKRLINVINISFKRNLLILLKINFDNNQIFNKSENVIKLNDFILNILVNVSKVYEEMHMVLYDLHRIAQGVSEEKLGDILDEIQPIDIYKNNKHNYNLNDKTQIKKCILEIYQTFKKKLQDILTFTDSFYTILTANEILNCNFEEFYDILFEESFFIQNKCLKEFYIKSLELFGIENEGEDS